MFWTLEIDVEREQTFDDTVSSKLCFTVRKENEGEPKSTLYRQSLWELLSRHTQPLPLSLPSLFPTISFFYVVFDWYPATVSWPVDEPKRGKGRGGTRTFPKATETIQVDQWKLLMGHSCASKAGTERGNYWWATQVHWRRWAQNIKCWHAAHGQQWNPSMARLSNE